MNRLGLNILIAIIWYGLSSSRSPVSLIVGFIMGFLLLSLLRSMITKRSYSFKLFGFLKFFILFIKEFLLSNINMIKIILFKSNADIHPQIIQYHVPDLAPHQTLILSQCITLTPGTTSIDISTDYKTITIHCIDAKNPEAVTQDIDTHLKKPLKEFTE